MSWNLKSGILVQSLARLADINSMSPEVQEMRRLDIGVPAQLHVL
jgi:hypothetical protein